MTYLKNNKLYVKMLNENFNKSQKWDKYWFTKKSKALFFFKTEIKNDNNNFI